MSEAGNISDMPGVIVIHMALAAWQLHSSIRSGNVLILSSSDDERRERWCCPAFRENKTVAITININGLTLCHKGCDGVSHNTLLDVCKTTPFGVPVPFPGLMVMTGHILFIIIPPYLPGLSMILRYPVLLTSLLMGGLSVFEENLLYRRMCSIF